MIDKQTLVDVNQAEISELVTIKGIGEGLAKRIIEQRPIQDLQDLVNVPGISQAKLESVLSYLTIKSKPVNNKLSKQPDETASLNGETPMTTVGHTEAFVFLEDRSDRQDALLIIFGGFIFGLLLLMLRRSCH